LLDSDLELLGCSALGITSVNRGVCRNAKILPRIFADGIQSVQAKVDTVGEIGFLPFLSYRGPAKSSFIEMYGRETALCPPPMFGSPTGCPKVGQGSYLVFLSDLRV
jgi:hypothetical protein